MPKLNCHHADTCLPDYWSGHHLPHISIPVFHGMHAADVRRALHSEVSEGAIAGNFSEESATEADYKRMHAAIDRDVRCAQKGRRRCFENLDKQTEDDAELSVYAYFVFTEN